MIHPYYIIIVRIYERYMVWYARGLCYRIKVVFQNDILFIYFNKFVINPRMSYFKLNALTNVVRQDSSLMTKNIL